jgi:hypothetical protein
MTNPFKKLIKSLFLNRTNVDRSKSLRRVSSNPVALPLISLEFDGWTRFANGNTLGSTGSELGKIVFDMESPSGARITLEHETEVAPYAVTFGVYGLMFHTHFCSSIEESLEYIRKSVALIESLFTLYDVPETGRDAGWQDQHDNLSSELTR